MHAVGAGSPEGHRWRPSARRRWRTKRELARSREAGTAVYGSVRTVVWEAGGATRRPTRSDSSYEEHEEMVEWLKGHAKNYWPYKPDEFEPASVKFDNPKKRFENAFSQP